MAILHLVTLLCVHAFLCCLPLPAILLYHHLVHTSCLPCLHHHHASPFALPPIPPALPPLYPHCTLLSLPACPAFLPGLLHLNPPLPCTTTCMLCNIPCPSPHATAPNHTPFLLPNTPSLCLPPTTFTSALPFFLSLYSLSLLSLYSNMCLPCPHFSSLPFYLR